MVDGPIHRDKELSQSLLIADKAETPTMKDRGCGSGNIQIARTVPQWTLAPKYDIILHPFMLLLYCWRCVRLIFVWTGRHPAIYVFKEDLAVVSPHSRRFRTDHELRRVPGTVVWQINGPS